MNFEISKELLSEVLEEDVKQIVFDLKIIHQKIRNGVKESEFVAYYNEEWNVLNIYKVVHMCKEWIFDKGYSIMSWQNTKGSYYAVVQKNDKVIVEFKDMSDEPSVIFKATEWVKVKKELDVHTVRLV